MYPDKTVLVECPCGEAPEFIISMAKVVEKWPTCYCGRMMKVSENATAPVENGIGVGLSRDFPRLVRRNRNRNRP